MLLAFALVLVLANVWLIAFTLGGPPASPPLPNPNGYLQGVPADPFTARPMVYLPEGTRWLLYSVGEHRVDNGGEPVSASVPGAVTKGDIFYNSPY